MAGLGEGHIASHRGPWLRRSSFRHLPTKHSGRKSCTPDNNATSPGHPHTGNLRSLPPFHGIQTQSCCQPRAPTTYWRRHGSSLTSRRKDVETRTQHSKEDIWIMRKYTTEAFTDKVLYCTRVVCQTGSVNTKAGKVLTSLFWSHMWHRWEFFNQPGLLKAGLSCIV